MEDDEPEYIEPEPEKRSGKLGVRMVGHPQEDRLGELHFKWKVDNWRMSRTTSVRESTVASSALQSQCGGFWRLHATLGAKEYERGSPKPIIVDFSLTLLNSTSTDGGKRSENGLHCRASWKVELLHGITNFKFEEKSGYTEYQSKSHSATFGSVLVDRPNNYGSATEQLMKTKFVIIAVSLNFDWGCVYSRSFKGLPKTRMAMSKELYDLYEIERLTDFVLISTEKRELKAHRNVLASKCEVFRAMLEYDTKEKRTGICEIEDIDYDTLKIVVDSLYGVDVRSRAAEIPEKVFEAADKYGLDHLKVMCIRQLEELTVENVVSRYVIAQKYGLADLVEEAVEFVRKNYGKFLNHGGMKEVTDMDPKASVRFFWALGLGQNLEPETRRSQVEISFG